MNFELYRAAQELQPEIAEWGVSVDVTTNTIGYGLNYTIIGDNVRRSECKRIIRKYIKQAEDEKLNKILGKQERMF